MIKKHYVDIIKIIHFKEKNQVAATVSTTSKGTKSLELADLP